MKNTLRIVAICTGAFVTASHAQTLVDLSDRSIDSGTINGAIYMYDSVQPAGTGIFGRSSGGVFLTIQGPNGGVEEGYNTSGATVMDTKRVPQWNHEITVASLGLVTVNNQDYVPFLLDINEPVASNKRFLSLDDVKIFTTQSSGITNPTLESLLADPRLTLRYDMDAGGNNSVLLDYTRAGGGSGKSDMALLIPASVFAGAALSDTVYLYSRFGGDISGAAAEGGFEEWTLGAGTRPIPEPSSSLLIGTLGMFALLYRRR